MRTALFLLLAVAPLWAHHATGAAYDASQVVTIQGIVTEVTWMNPHANFLMDATDASGSVARWAVETISVNALNSQGCTKRSFKVGDRVTIEVWLAKSGGHRAYMRSLMLADGRIISGKSGWDPPYDFTKK